MLGFFGWLFDVVRNLAVMAAAVGVAKWAWDRHQAEPSRRDEAARDRIETDRLRADVRQSMAKIETLLQQAASRQPDAVAAARRTAALDDGRVRVHRILQTTDEHYLGFAELEALCASGSGGAAGLAGDGLRQVLIELVADGVIHQLGHDRYFIASDFETDDDPSAASA